MAFGGTGSTKPKETGSPRAATVDVAQVDNRRILTSTGITSTFFNGSQGEPLQQVVKKLGLTGSSTTT